MHPQTKGFRFILDNLNTHQSEQIVRYIAQKENPDGSQLGLKGKSGILKDMKTRQAFLTDTNHKIVFYLDVRDTSPNQCLRTP